MQVFFYNSSTFFYLENYDTAIILYPNAVWLVFLVFFWDKVGNSLDTGGE